LNYSLVLPIEETGPTGTIPGTNRFVMECNARAISSVLGRIARVEGHTDLAVNGLKFSGNAQRRRHRWLLFHGTFLINYDAALMERLLRPPPRQPAYRMNRRHSDFLMQINAPRDAVKSALCRAWNATLPASNIPFSAMARLVAEKYSKPEWNLRW
jgi:lipoate-protein ligase A